MRQMLALFAAVALIPACFAQAGGSPVFPNPGFEETTVRPVNDPELIGLKNIGWKFTDPIDWPIGWSSAAGSNVTVAISREKPHSGRNCLLLWGQSGSSGYMGTKVGGLENTVYKVSFYGRGRGTATLMTPGVHLVLNRRMTGEWARYSGIFKNTAGVGETTVTLQAQGASVWFDDLAIEKCDALEEMRAQEEALLVSKGALLGAGARVDTAAFTANTTKIAQAIPRLQSLVAADPIPANVEAIGLLKTKSEALKLSASPTVEEMNDAICYASICEKLLLELDFVEAEEGK